MSETDAAFCAAAGKDLAAVAGSHALAKPMLLGALTLFGLIGTYHVCTPPVPT